MAEAAGFQTKTEWIYSQLRDMITSGELPSGSRLPLAPLAERFGTSEIPVREAMRMLQSDRMVRIESHRGATVASVSWEQLYESIFVRSYLEILAIQEAVPLHDDGVSQDGARRSPAHGRARRRAFNGNCDIVQRGQPSVPHQSVRAVPVSTPHGADRRPLGPAVANALPVALLYGPRADASRPGRPLGHVRGRRRP